MTQSVTSHDLAYLAGLLDGEGCICITTRTMSRKRREELALRGFRPLQLAVSITNCHMGVLAWAKQAFGLPCVLHQKNNRPNPCYQIHWINWNAAEVLQAVYPFLKIKKGEAEIALKFQSTFQRRKWSRYLDPEKAASREEMRQQLREAKTER